MNRRVVQIPFFLLAVALFFFCSKVEAASPSVVIGSYRIASATTTTDEFVELYNPTGVPISITGWQLAKKTASGTKYNLVSAFPPAVINPRESFLVGHKDSTEPVQIMYTSGYSISEDNTILLFSDSGKTVVDKVGFGKAADFEGTVAPAAGSDLWSRKNGLDTDNNAKDFIKYSGPVKDYSGICLSEIEPSPAEGEEWIEIYNSEMAKDIGGLIIADRLGSVKQFVVPEGTMIKEGQYLVFYKKDTGITLNDDGDGVVLIDATGKVFDNSGEFGKATKGSSFAFDGTRWQWTANVTPSLPNRILASDSAATLSSKKRADLTLESPTSSTKGTVPGAEVLGATKAGNQSYIFDNKPRGSANDRLFGLMLLGVALAGGLVYTIYVNREKIIAAYNEERKEYSGSWEKIRSKLPWR